MPANPHQNPHQPQPAPPGANHPTQPGAVLRGGHPQSARTTAVAAVTLVAVVGAGVAWALTRPDAEPAVPPSDPAVASRVQDPRVQDLLDGLVTDHGFPGVLAHVVDADGTPGDYTAGVGDLATGAQVPVDGQVRIASNTKTFTATVVLQLVGEGLVELDEPIETYLPGLVRGEGNDGAAITVRQLLQHTSGLYNYTADMDPDSFARRDVYVPQRHHTDVALAHPPLFAPGAQWSYSNTNYTLLGMLVEKVTGRPMAEQVTERIIEPLGLAHTYVPGPGERELRGEHPRGYHPDASGELADITALDPSWAGAAGDIVSTPSDLFAFFRALAAGELLGPAEQAELTALVELPQEYPGDGYGLGITITTASCGVVLWGHGGDIEGFSTRVGVTEDGRGVAYAVTSLPTSLETVYAMEDVVDAIVCRD